MGQRDKLLEDTANVLDWMNDDNFRSFVTMLVTERPHTIQRLQKEIARAQKKQLTHR